MCRSASRRNACGRPNAKARPLAEGVEAVLRAREHGHAGEPAGGEPVEVGVDEMGVEQRRLRRADGDEPAERARVDRRAAAASRRQGRRRARGARRTPRRRARPRAGAGNGRHSRARAAPGAGAEQMVLRARDPRDLRDVQDGRSSLTRATSSTRSAQTLDRVVALDLPRSSRPIAGRSTPRAPRIASARRRRPRARSAARSAGARRTRGSTRARAGTSPRPRRRSCPWRPARMLLTSASTSARAQGPAVAASGRRSSTRSPTPSSSTSRSSAARCARSSSVSDGPTNESGTSGTCGDRPDDRFQTLRRRRAPEREQRSGSVARPLDAREAP